MELRFGYLSVLVGAAGALVSCSDRDRPTSPVQPPAVSVWQSVIGGEDTEWAVAVVAAPDGNYAVAGGLKAAGSEYQDFLLVKVDSLGGEVWRHSYGGALSDFCRAVAVTADGGYIIAGSTYSFGVANSDVYLVKTDSAGTLEWEKTFGGDKWETVHQVIATSDCGYAVAGWTSSFDAPGGSDAWLIKTNCCGDLVFEKRYGGSDHDAFYSVAEANGGGFVMAGETESFGAGNSDIYMVQVDGSGDIAWQKTFGGSGNDLGTGVVAMPGGYAACGWVGSSSVTNQHGAYDAYVVRVNLEGNLLWESCYGGAGYDGCEELVSSSDGGFVVGGHIQNMTNGGTTGYLFKVSGTGNLVWERTLGNSSEAIEAVAAAKDGGFVAAGAYYSETTVNQDVYLVKTDASGRTGQLEK